VHSNIWSDFIVQESFALLPGGRGVVEGIGKQLQLSREQKAPSANTLHYFGNTSSSTVWYSLSFIETCQNIRRGDVVWQVSRPLWHDLGLHDMSGHSAVTRAWHLRAPH
jgi:hypothetical protein